MMTLLRFVGATAIAVGLALPAWGQSNTTFVLQSGERVSGELVDMGGGGFTVRVNGQTRNFGPREIAVIDFDGGGSYPASEVNQLNGNHVLVLRNGSTLTGRLVDVGGTAPRRITFSTGGTSREFSSNEIARIYLARPDGSPSTSGAQSSTGNERTVRVRGNSGWVDTGIMVFEGQRLGFDTSGEVRLSTDRNDVAAPAGARSGRRAANAPLPNTAAGALIGRIGDDGEPFGIGNQNSITAPASGRLYLAVNDDVLGDNVGEFTVRITAQPRTGAVRRR